MRRNKSNLRLECKAGASVCFCFDQVRGQAVSLEEQNGWHQEFSWFWTGSILRMSYLCLSSGPIQTGREHTHLRQILWCCLRPVWTLPLATAGSICLRLAIASSVDLAKAGERHWVRLVIMRSSVLSSFFSFFFLRFRTSNSLQENDTIMTGKKSYPEVVAHAWALTP